MSDKDVKPTLVANIKNKTQKGAKSKPKCTHPSTSEMVTTAIKVLKSRRGTSLYAIKKFVAENYEVNIERLSPFIKSFLRKAVNSGILVQCRGTGAAGSFKLSKFLDRPTKLPTVEYRRTIKTHASRKAWKKRPGGNVKAPKKIRSTAEVMVKNEPVTEEIVVKVEPLMEEDDDESLEEEGMVMKKEDSMDEEEEEEEVIVKEEPVVKAEKLQ